MAIEIVDFPIKNGGSFHSFLLNYQRVLGFAEKGVSRKPMENSQRFPDPWWDRVTWRCSYG